MVQLASWMLLLTVAVCAVILSTGTGDLTTHMAVTGLVSLLLAFVGVRENNKLRSSGASEYAISAATARSMGLVWTWGALCLLIIYAVQLTWVEWWQFCLVFAALAVLCLFIAATLEKDEAKGMQDDTMLRIGNALAKVQLIGMLAVVIGLILDGKLERFAKARPGWEDWAGNNIFFFGAVALAAISGHAIYTQRKAKQAGGDA